MICIIYIVYCLVYRYYSAGRVIEHNIIRPTRESTKQKIKDRRLYSSAPLVIIWNDSIQHCARPQWLLCVVLYSNARHNKRAHARNPRYCVCVTLVISIANKYVINRGFLGKENMYVCHQKYIIILTITHNDLKKKSHNNNAATIIAIVIIVIL